MTTQDTEASIPPRNGGLRPVPDPTSLTDAAIERLKESLTAYIDGNIARLETRMDGSDEATRLRVLSLDRLPAVIDEKVGNLKTLSDQRFGSVQTQFGERDTRSERESQLSKDALDAAFSASKEAVAAALTAQKEASALQNEAFAKAIDKSETATAETISKLSQLAATTNSAITDKIDDLKERVNRIESAKQGAQENKIQTQDSRTAVYATIGLVITVVLFGITIVGFVLSSAGAK